MDWLAQSHNVKWKHPRELVIGNDNRDKFKKTRLRSNIHNDNKLLKFTTHMPDYIGLWSCLL